MHLVLLSQCDDRGAAMHLVLLSQCHDQMSACRVCTAQAHPWKDPESGRDPASMPQGRSRAAI